MAVDATELHRRLLVRCDPTWYGLRDDPPAAIAALRAVVELHAPASPEPTADGLLWFCSSGEVGMLAEGAAVWPCATIRAVAGALGVPTAGDHG